MTDRPIFLAGIDRSGIGLLGETLEAHPEVAISRRINYWDFYAERFGDLADPSNLERCLDSMMSYTRVARLQPDVEAIRAEFVQGEATYPRLFRLLQEQNMRRLGKRRWGDKSHGAEGHARRILADFPGATILHVIRDPRDRYASQATHRSPGLGGVGSGVAAWLWSARLARRHGHDYPGRYLPVRYEDLVARPEMVLRSICAFAGIPFDPAMLTPAGPFHTDSIGRYRRGLTGAEISFVERVAGREMRRWGYEPEGAKNPVPERLRFLATGFPAAATGLVLWRPWRTARRLLGSGPSARRLVQTDRGG